MRCRVASTRALFAAATSVALIAGACGDDADEDSGSGDEEAQGDAPAAPHFGGHESELYSDDANWLCKPGIADNVCEQDLDSTAVFADGTTEVQPHEPAEDPAVDCFYIYPTISFDEESNSDLEVDDAEEVFVTLNQAARLTASCRVFAPTYRQATLGMIGSRDDPPDGVNPWEAADEDVNDAFRHDVDNESDGRGFVLVGHSQGAGHLRQLIIDEIDDDPELRDRLVSALLIGTTVAVPDGEVVGGDFANVPACETPDQTSCVISYASFRADEPPPDNSFFGRSEDGEGSALCVNPANLDGSAAPTQPYFQVEIPEGSLGTAADPSPMRIGPTRSPHHSSPCPTSSRRRAKRTKSSRTWP